MLEVTRSVRVCSLDCRHLSTLWSIGCRTNVLLRSKRVLRHYVTEFQCFRVVAGETRVHILKCSAFVEKNVHICFCMYKQFRIVQGLPALLKK
jgi:hypothetical protein